MIPANTTGAGIALNVTRTRVTVLAFNLTIVSIMLSIKVSKGEITSEDVLPHLTSTVALFTGFCVTLLGLWWLLVSQNQDTQGLSKPWPFTFGSITTYLALSQTTSAFMHEYLLGLKKGIYGTQQAIFGPSSSLVGQDPLGYTAWLVLFVIGAAIWLLITYVAPLITVLKGPLAGRRAWVFSVYYLAIQIPIFWVYSKAWQIASLSEHVETSNLTLFLLQFLQPVLWFR